jgi:hypothetical protein
MRDVRQEADNGALGKGLLVAMDKRGDDGAGADRAALENSAACEMVREFFATFGARGATTEQRIQAMVRRAAKRRSLRPEHSLATLALDEAEAAVTAWSFYILGKERIGDHPPILLARAAYHACNGPERWPDAVLDYDLAAECVLEMRRAMPEPTPPERRGRMVEQPLDTWAPTKTLRPWVLERLSAVFALDQRGG